MSGKEIWVIYHDDGMPIAAKTDWQEAQDYADKFAQAEYEATK